MKIIAVLSALAAVLFVILASYVLLQLLRRSRLQETLLRVELIKLKEAIQQAERKSMNKSLAFASASHDIRTSLAGIVGLIELCCNDIPPASELHRNLEQMNNCASKLLGILNSVLDTSKIEAGKMQLEEVEFNVAQVLEESADIFHVVALKKGLEVIWDPCDCSILTSANVRGDCRRFKQIIDNLLGNAVKFTSKGHVILRAWARKPGVGSVSVSSKKALNPLLSWVSKSGSNKRDRLVQNNLNLVEIVIEVDDTGMGIPKEKRASVFENYVQVKEPSTAGHEGTGLGLGIVQSYVRLMGGEIKIQDKNPGEGGTCFRFNILLKSTESDTDNRGLSRDEKSSIFPVQSPSPVNPSMKLEAVRSAFKRDLAVDGAHSILFMQGAETARILQRWMESLGVKVWVINRLELIHHTVENIKDNLGSCRVPTTELANDEHGTVLPVSSKDIRNCSRRITANVLILIDINDGDLSETAATLKGFASQTAAPIHYKIVWLMSSIAACDDLRRRSKEVPCHLVLQKPILGTRLYALLKLVQDFERGNVDHPAELPPPPLGTTSIPEQQNHRAGTSTERRTSAGDHRKPLSGMSILLVEDTPMLRYLASAKITRLGASVGSCENGLDALNLVRDALEKLDPARGGGSMRFPYDAILMDCLMPVMDGYEATRRIREEARRYGVRFPIIALTAHATTEEVEKTRLAGMDFHLTKPLQDDELVKAVLEYR